MIDVETVATLLLALSFGGAVGTGVLVLWIQHIFHTREKKLEQRIYELEARYNALLDVMVKEHLLSAAAAEHVKKPTGPLNVRNELHIGGDAVGRDKSG